MTVADYYCRFVEPKLMDWQTIQLVLYNTNGDILCPNYCDTINDEFDNYVVYSKRYRQEGHDLLRVGLYVISD